MDKQIQVMMRYLAGVAEKFSDKMLPEYDEKLEAAQSSWADLQALREEYGPALRAEPLALSPSDIDYDLAIAPAVEELLSTLGHVRSVLAEHLLELNHAYPVDTQSPGAMLIGYKGSESRAAVTAGTRGRKG